MKYVIWASCSLQLRAYGAKANRDSARVWVLLASFAKFSQTHRTRKTKVPFPGSSLVHLRGFVSCCEWPDLRGGYVAQVCLSCLGVCVRHWFGVGAFAWCEYFLGSCVFFPGVGVLLSRLESCTTVMSTTTDWTSSGRASLVRSDPLAQCGHAGCGARWLIWWPSLRNV